MSTFGLDSVWRARHCPSFLHLGIEEWKIGCSEEVHAFEAIRKLVVIHRRDVHMRDERHILPRRELCTQENSPMNKTAEIVLIALALAGMYCAIPKNWSQIDNSRIGAQQMVVVADGSDPMPLCRGKACK